ncbi:MAG TPA: hypothetical protein VNS59_07425 [Lysobacter sp.]|nr:hypothetical protein [Lysobacter sp.]
MHRILRFLCLTAAASTMAAAYAAEPAAASYTLTCNIRGATTTGASGDIRGDGVTTHPTRTSSSQSVSKIEVSTQPKAVVMQLQSGSSTDSDGVTQPYQAEGPRYIEDVRVLTPTMLVFCDDATNGCRPQDKSNSTGGRTRVETSPVTVNLGDGSLGYRSAASITGGNGSMLYSRTEYIGTCTKGS